MLILIAELDPNEEIIVDKEIKKDKKQTSLSIYLVCLPINLGARMSLATSHMSSVVASPAPLVCEALQM